MTVLSKFKSTCFSFETVATRNPKPHTLVLCQPTLIPLTSSYGFLSHVHRCAPFLESMLVLEDLTSLDRSAVHLDNTL